MLPMFSGESPILPPPINYALLIMLQEAIAPDRALAGAEREELEVRRAVSLQVLHKYVEAQTHARALKIIEDAWARESDFGLYLRGFSLGGVNTGELEDEEIDGPLLFRNTFTIISMVDDTLQRTLIKHIAQRLPIVSIENPAYDQRSENSLPKLSLSDTSWKSIVRKLIAAAKVILIYYDQVSPGIIDELRLVRRLRRQGSTIIIKPSAEVVSELKGVYELRRRAAEVFTPHQQAAYPDPSEVRSGIEDLNDFPVVITWDGSRKSIKRLKEAIAQISARRGQEVRFSKRVPAPDAPRPPEYIKAWTDNSISAHLIMADDKLEKGDLTGVEDEFTACIAMSYWGDDPKARAVAFLCLGRVQLYQEKTRYAVENLGRALDVLERLALSDYSVLSGMFAEISAKLKQYRRHRVVRLLLKRIARLQAISAAR